MLTIRLQRTGKKHQPVFRIVVAEAREHVTKKFQEVLGSYNPRKKDFVISNTERLNYWIAQNIKMSPTVNNLLVNQKIISTAKVKAFTLPKKAVEVKAEEAPATTPAPAAE